MGKVSKGAEETLQSLSIHGSWTQFPEMFWSIRQISPPLSYTGVQMLAFRCNHVQINAGNTRKGAPAVTSRLSNGQELSKAAALCIPVGFPPNPFLSILKIPFSLGPREGHRKLVWWADASVCGGCGVVMMWDTFPCTPLCGPEHSGFGNWGGSAGGPCPACYLSRAGGAWHLIKERLPAWGCLTARHQQFCDWQTGKKYICLRIIYIENWTQDFVFVNSAVISAVWTKGRVYFPSI